MREREGKTNLCLQPPTRGLLRPLQLARWEVKAQLQERKKKKQQPQLPNEEVERQGANRGVASELSTRPCSPPERPVMSPAEGHSPLGWKQRELWVSLGLSGMESSCQCRSCGFDPWSRKIPWRRNWRPILVFLPGNPHEQRSILEHSSTLITWYAIWFLGS